MKKVGILTFHRAQNYGAVLQAYALKNILIKLNVKAEIIDYLCSYMVYNKKYNFIPKKIKLFLQLLMKLKKYNLLKKYLNFKFFQIKFLNDTMSFSDKSICKVNKKYDLFVVGSDQVFGLRLTGFDKNYFFDFVKDKNKCCSYAASFGLSYNDLTDKEKIFIKQNLKNFKYLSLREKQGTEIVNKLSNIKTYVHIDPTLLLNRQDWLSIAKNPKEKDFILVYLIHSDKKIIDYINLLSIKTNLKIYYISLKHKNDNSFINIRVSPQKFLGYFLKARYIVTNSFHGLAFSINFNKQFVVDLSCNTSNTNSRLENLLDLTNLKDRLIDNIGTNYDKPIDWDNVNKIIEQEREKSINYLKEIIK